MKVFWPGVAVPLELVNACCIFPVMLNFGTVSLKALKGVIIHCFYNAGVTVSL